MKRAAVSILLLVFLAAGCGSDDDPAGPGTGSNEVSAKIDGQAWAADPMTIYLTGEEEAGRQGTFLIGGTRIIDDKSIALALSFIRGPGEYPLGVTGVTTAGGTGIVEDTLTTWLTPLNGEAGTVTITARTDTRIAGTFSFTAIEYGGSGSGTVQVTEGEFDVTLSEGLPPLPTGFGSVTSANLNGDFWNAAEVTATSAGDGEFSLVGVTSEFSISLSPQVPVLAGNTYAIPSQMSFAIYNIAADESWQAEDGPDVGSVTLIEFTNDKLVGTFQGTIPQLTGGSTPMVVSEGEFDLSLQPSEIKGRP